MTAGKVEGIAAERDELAKGIVDLEAQLKQSKFRLEESKLRATKERRLVWSLKRN